MHPRGVVLQITRSTEKIDMFVKQKGFESFTTQAACEATGVNYNTVHSVLYQKVKKLALKKISRGLYAGTGQKLALRSPNAIIVENLWEVLRSARVPMSREDAAIQVELRLNNPAYSASISVGTSLGRWFKAGFLQRFGERGSYEYMPKDGITERPVSTYTP